MSQEVVFRKFKPDDQDAVHALYRSGMNGYLHIPTAGQCYANFINDKLKPEGDMSNIQAHFMDRPGSKSCFWVAELNGALVGCVGAVPTSKYSEDHVELERMFVSPDCRKMAIGARLVGVLEEWAKEAGYTNIYISTLGALTEPNKLYPKCGFVLKEADDVDISEFIGVPSPAIVVENHYVKAIV